MAHPLPTFISESCDGLVYCMALWANDATNGLFWVLALLGFMVVIVIATNTRFGGARSFGYGMLVGAMASVWLFILGLLSAITFSMFAIAGGIGILILATHGKG